MFISNLNPKQQAVLLNLAEEVAKADGDLHELQLGMVDILTQQCNAEVTAQSADIADLSAIYDSEQARCSLLLELIGVAFANEEYHHAEKKPYQPICLCVICF